jgi:ADP-ribosylglycohydrolase
VEKSEVIDRFRGAILGMVAGDALGMPANGMSSYETLTQYQLIDAFYPGSRFGLEPGAYTACSQLALMAAKVISQKGEPDRDELKKAYSGSTREDLDPHSLKAIQRLKDGGDYEEGAESSSSSSYLPRMIPAGLWASLLSPSHGELLRVCRTLSLPTHAGRPPATTGYPIARAISECIVNSEKLDSPYEMYSSDRSLLSRMIEVTRLAEDKLSADEGGGGMWMRLREVSSRLQGGASVDEVSGLFGNEDKADSIVPVSLFIFMRSPDDARGIFKSAGLGGAASVRAALVGAMCGAFFGEEVLPEGIRSGVKNGARIAALGEKMAEKMWEVVASKKANTEEP